MSRREFLFKGGVALFLANPLASIRVAYSQEASNTLEDSLSTSDLREQWMNSSVTLRDLQGNLVLSRFVEPVYFLLKEISWEPNPGASKSYGKVSVPVGFVTDLTSVPRVFWSILPRDGQYTYAAIIHDYLYWEQSVSREDADDIFRLAMEDLEISAKIIKVIYSAVRFAGNSAWEENRRLKERGEKRVLKDFPAAPSIRWVDWKQRKDVFI